MLLFKLKFNQTLGVTMNKKLIVGLGLILASLNLMSAVQRVVPRVALSAGGSALAMRRIAPHVSAANASRLLGSMPAARLAVSNSLPKVIVDQQQGSSVFGVRSYMAMAALAVAGVGQVVKCDRDADDLLLAATTKGDIDDIRKALQAGANVNKKDGYHGYAPLNTAACIGNLEIVRTLLERADIDVNAAGVDGRTPLYLAAFNGNLEIVKLLLGQPGINVNALEEDGHTPLYSAASCGHVEVVKLLLEQSDINVNATNKYRRGALFVAARSGNAEMVKLLLERSDIVVDSYLLSSLRCMNGIDPELLLLAKSKVCFWDRALSKLM